MTALQWIIKEAKILRKKSPKMEWKKAVAQASAIYSSKHKGKSPVGKKKSAKKVVRKKAAKKLGTVKHKVKRKVAKKKKPSEQSILNKIHTVKHNVERLDEAQHKHMMTGVNTHAINDYKEILGKIRYYENTIQMYREAIKNHKSRGISAAQLKNLKLWVKTHSKLLSEYKTHAKELKKHL